LSSVAGVFRRDRAAAARQPQLLWVWLIGRQPDRAFRDLVTARVGRRPPSGMKPQVRHDEERHVSGAGFESVADHQAGLGPDTGRSGTGQAPDGHLKLSRDRPAHEIAAILSAPEVVARAPDRNLAIGSQVGGAAAHALIEAGPSPPERRRDSRDRYGS